MIIAKLWKDPVWSKVIAAGIFAIGVSWIPGVQSKIKEIAVWVQYFGMNAVLIPYWILFILVVLVVSCIVLTVRNKLNYDSARIWAQKKRRYKLYAPFESGVVYALKESKSNGDAAHYACTVCFENAVISILDSKSRPRQDAVLVCPVCNSEVQSLYSVLLDPEFPPE